MTQEEKANAYDEALALMKDCIPDKDGYVCVRPCDIFSELQESKDEKIRKELVEYFRWNAQILNDFDNREVIAWLEKQVKKTAIFQHENKTCKRNNDSLTCEDERVRKAIHIYLDWLDGRKDYAPKGKYTIRDMIAWLEKQKDYVSPQMVADAYLRGCNDTEKKWLEKQGQSFPILSNSSKTVKDWTEEDEHHWMMCFECVEECATQKRKDFSKTISWLKQLKQRLEQ